MIFYTESDNYHLDVLYTCVTAPFLMEHKLVNTVFIQSMQLHYGTNLVCYILRNKQNSNTVIC